MCGVVVVGWWGGGGGGVVGWWWWGGGPCDYCVSPSPKDWVFGFFRLGLNLGVRIYLTINAKTGDENIKSSEVSITWKI